MFASFVASTGSPDYYDFDLSDYRIPGFTTTRLQIAEATPVRPMPRWASSSAWISKPPNENFVSKTVILEGTESLGVASTYEMVLDSMGILTKPFVIKTCIACGDSISAVVFY